MNGALRPCSKRLLLMRTAPHGRRKRGPDHGNAARHSNHVIFLPYNKAMQKLCHPYGIQEKCSLHVTLRQAQGDKKSTPLAA
jgi:hypothetical protein